MFSNTCNLLSIQLHYVSAYQKSLPIVLSPFTLSEILQIFFAFYFLVRIQLSWYVYQILEFFTGFCFHSSYYYCFLFLFYFYFYFYFYFFWINYFSSFSSSFSSFSLCLLIFFQIDGFNFLLSTRLILCEVK